MVLYFFIAKVLLGIVIGTIVGFVITWIQRDDCRGRVSEMWAYWKVAPIFAVLGILLATAIALFTMVL